MPPRKLVGYSTFRLFKARYLSKQSKKKGLGHLFRRDFGQAIGLETVRRNLYVSYQKALTYAFQMDERYELTCDCSIRTAKRRQNLAPSLKLGVRLFKILESRSDDRV